MGFGDSAKVVIKHAGLNMVKRFEIGLFFKDINGFEGLFDIALTGVDPCGHQGRNKFFIYCAFHVMERGEGLGIVAFGHGISGDDDMGEVVGVAVAKWNLGILGGFFNPAFGGENDVNTAQ